MEAIPLDPVDSLTVTTLVDNVTDNLLPDQGPAKRPSIASAPRVPARFLAGGDTDDALRAEHGFSALVTITKAGRETRGPVRCRAISGRDGGEHAPAGAVAARHRHHRPEPRSLGSHDRDGRAGPRARQASNVPVLIHPEFWSRRRVALPGSRPGRAADDEQGRAGGRRLRDRRGAPAFVPARRLAARDRRGRPDNRVRARVPWSRGSPRGGVAAGPADPRRPGAGGRRARTGPRRPDRLRALRDHQHSSLHTEDHRPGPLPRRGWRVPPQRTGVRADHRADLRRVRRVRARLPGAGALHRLAGDPERSPPVPRRVHPEQRGDQVRVRRGRLISRVAAVLGRVSAAGHG